MNFEAFDKSEMEQYKAEARAKWGSTKAYQEYEEKAAAQNEKDYEKAAAGLMTIFSELGELKQLSPAAEAVQKKIASLQSFITDNYYMCTNEILGGLGEMYVYDERFKRNIDKAGGDGTAEFAGKAIAAYCRK